MFVYTYMFLFSICRLYAQEHATNAYRNYKYCIINVSYIRLHIKFLVNVNSFKVG